MVEGDNKTSIVTAFWAFIAGLRYFIYCFFYFITLYIICQIFKKMLPSKLEK